MRSSFYSFIRDVFISYGRGGAASIKNALNKVKPFGIVSRRAVPVNYYYTFPVCRRLSPIRVMCIIIFILLLVSVCLYLYLFTSRRVSPGKSRVPIYSVVFGTRADEHCHRRFTIIK